MKRVTAFRHAARFLVFVLAQTLVLQPAAFAAWNLAQQPLFTINAVQPNAVFMLDDSWSMNEYRLPPPAFFSVGSRWPSTTNVTVKYGAGTRTVAAHNEFTLRSSVHNPLAYDPAITYRPWNDNDKPPAARGTRPNRAENFPPADIGGTGTTATTANPNLTERDMRFRGFANASPTSPRLWITEARGTVGGTGSFASGSPAANRWTWDASNPSAPRWTRTLTSPAGLAVYPSFPGDGAQAADLFTKICTGWVQEPDGFQNGSCNAWNDGWDNVCIDWSKKPKYKNVCHTEEQPDPTSETGYRDVQVCNLVDDGLQNDQCIAWAPPVYNPKKTCVGWNQVPKFKNGACNQYALAPARFYRYEGSVPASDDDLAVPGNYRLVEIDRANPDDFAVPVDPRTGDVRKRADCQVHADPAHLEGGAALCTRLEEMQNYANWFTYYRHRLFAAMAVTSHAAADLKGDLSSVRLGYGRINYFHGGPDPWNPGGARLDSTTFPELDNDPASPAHPGAVVRGVRDFSDTPGNVARQQFFDWIFSLNWVGSTPNREAMDSIGNYYLRDSDYGPWSDNPGVGGGRSGDQHAACRRSFAILASDGEWTAMPTTPPSQLIQPLITSRTPDPVGAGNGTVIASLATTGPTIPGAGLYAAETYVYSPGAEPQFSTGNGGVTQTLTDVALYWWNRDLRPTVPNAVQKRPSQPNDSFWQNVTTFVVGYGLNASMNTPATRQAIIDGNAVNWPVVDITPTLITGGERINDTMRAAMATRGDFYSASDPDQMRKSIRGVFRAIAEQAFSGTGLGSTSAQLTVGTTLYRASFRTQVWTGQLEAFDAMDMAMAAKNSTPPPAALWEASFPDWDKRNLVTSTAKTTAIPFDDYTTLTAQQQADLVSVYVMDYIRGKQIGLEVGKGDPLNGDATLGFRARSTLLGSIVSSTPLYSKAPDFGYRLNPAAGGGNYIGYVNSHKASRKAAVYVGANAGVFHAFDANPNPLAGGGKELFGYVPRSTYQHLKELTNTEYVHRFFVDGPVVEGDVYLGSSWKTVVMGSSGAGAPGLFALDVTDPTAFNKDKVLWDITPDEEPDLGRVMGHGYIGSVKHNSSGKWVAIVPNGYQSANNRAVLLIIDMATGNTLKKIDTCKKNNGTDFGAAEQGGRCDSTDPTIQNGLANVSVIYDANRNVTGVLSGDYQGNLWRFDLSSSDPADWKIATEDPGDGSGNTPAPVFTAKNAANQPQPITTAPRAATHPFGGIYVVFGTGKFFEYQDQTSNEMQSVYGIWLKPNDKHPVEKTDLQVFGLTENAGPPVTRTINGVTGFSWRAKQGWYFNLTAGASLGERVIADPVIDRGMLSMTSFQPTSAENPCEGGGTSYFYTIPMDASVYDIGATRVNGVVSSITRLTIESPTSGTRATDLNKADAEASLKSTDITRNLDGSTSIDNRVLECVKIYNQVNVQTGYLPGQCGFTAPIRVWRPIR